MGRHKITPRVETTYHIDDVIGCIFSMNVSPTLRAQLLGYDDKLAYFRTTQNSKWHKYNKCAGQEFWMPLRAVVCMTPLKLSCPLEKVELKVANTEISYDL